MKLPATPDYTKNDLSRALERIRDQDVLDAVFQENARYLHWDEIRRRKKYPADPLVIWILMKFFRNKNAHPITIGDWTFQYLFKRLLLERTAFPGQDGSRNLLGCP